jgi:serine/threonine-protein kinase
MFMLQGGDVERFARERDALAALSHPHVARLYDAGVLPSGQPFIVLEHVDGMPFTVYCDAQRLDLRARLRLFLQVLGAVEHAHKHLIVHRDLKPSNILVDAEGQVKLLDFGIAKLLGETEGAAPLTEMAGAAMTPLYAAPEQLRNATISTLTDVYSLGVVLHELLTGALPYRGAGVRASLVEILECLGRGTLPRASHAAIEDAAAIARARPSSAKLRSDLAGDLDTIVGKALRIAPDERYGSAAHLADDLKRYLDQKPIAARPPSFWYATRLAITRHRMAASVAGVGLALVAGASLVARMQYLESRAHAERTAAVRNFMFDLVSDAEIPEGQESEVTGKQMIDGAVLRARRDFGAQPQLQGELLGELGRMYMRLDEIDAAMPVLSEAIASLEKHASPGDSALNRARAYLAAAWLQTSDDLQRTGALATRARQSCNSQETECAKVRVYAGSTLSQIASFSGDDERALSEIRRTVADAELAFGTAHEDIAMQLLHLAMVARNAGHLVEASDAVKRALSITKDLRMRAANRTDLERTMAIVDYDLGHYEAARNRLVAMRARTGDRNERALLSRLMANVELELGDAEGALASAESAIAIHKEEQSGEALAYALQAKARALALMGRPEDAIAQIEDVQQRLQAAGSGPDSFEILRAQRYHAQFLSQAGRDAQALTEARALSVRHAAGTTSPIEHGLTYDLLGELEQRAGNSDAARTAHDVARGQLLKQLPEGHPYLVRNAALLSANKKTKEGL